MATKEQVAQVRLNTDEPKADTWDDDRIRELIDELGEAGASASIWRQKAAYYAKLVDVSEAGSSHAFSDLLKNAQSMLTYWDGRSGSSGGSAKVHVIDRS